MKRVAVLFGAAGLLALGAFVKSQGATKGQDEQELRRIESETAKFEQQKSRLTWARLPMTGFFSARKRYYRSASFKKREAEFCGPRQWPESLHD